MSIAASLRAARTAHPPARAGRAAALLAVSVAFHWWLLGGVQRLADGVTDARVTPARTVTAVLLAPPPPPAPAVRRAPRPPKVTAPAAVAVPPPEFAPEPAAAPSLPAEQQSAEQQPSGQQTSEPQASDKQTSEQPPAESAPPATETPAAAPEAAAPVADEAVLPSERADGTDLAAELAETGVLPGGLPARATYVYLTTGSEYAALIGETSIDWTLAEDGRYEARLTTAALGITVLALTSTGQVRPFGLAPERYTQKRIRRAEEAANFDWDRQRVTFSSRSFERELREGIQDRLSFQFQLMVLAQRLPERFRHGAAIEFPVAGPDGVDTYAFVVGDEEMIATELGEFVARKIERPRSIGGADSRIEVWLAPALQWLPVKLRFTDRRGRTTENVLLRIDDGSQPAPDPARWP